MDTFDPKHLRQRIDALRREDAARTVFGAISHGYELRSSLTDKDLVAAERQWGVTFPDEYRAFLLEVGSGGAGPAYGIFPLVQARGVWQWEGDGADLVSDLRNPFPHAAAWNPSYPERGEDDDEDEYWSQRDAWDEAVYWKPAQTHGAICICHEGCAIRDWLVVTGPERGHVWVDDRANDQGLMPREASGQRVTFGGWYVGWLDAAERAARARAT
jgi:hypothetical protein